MAQQRKKAEPRGREVFKEFCNNQFKPIVAKTDKQKEFLKAIKNSTISFGTGCAGTGKSFIAIGAACEALIKGQVDKVLISRPMIPASFEEIGALPGDLEDKFVLPYIGPVRHIFDYCLGKGHTEMFIKEGKIACSPLAFMRGSTHDRTYMILDEAQNCQPEQVKMFLTRIGEASKIVIVGDSMQSDIRNINGLEDAVRRLSWHPDISVVNFERSDIVRNSIISDLLQSYEDKIL